MNVYYTLYEALSSLLMAICVEDCNQWLTGKRAGMSGRTAHSIEYLKGGKHVFICAK
jgi:hypothetical protein